MQTNNVPDLAGAARSFICLIYWSVKTTANSMLRKISSIMHVIWKNQRCFHHNNYHKLPSAHQCLLVNTALTPFLTPSQHSGKTGESHRWEHKCENSAHTAPIQFLTQVWINCSHSFQLKCQILNTWFFWSMLAITRKNFLAFMTWKLAQKPYQVLGFPKCILVIISCGVEAAQVVHFVLLFRQTFSYRSTTWSTRPWNTWQ